MAKRLLALFCLLLGLADTMTAQTADRNAPLAVTFNTLTYTPQSNKVTAGKVLGIIADAMVGQSTQEHENYQEALRAAIVKGMAQCRRIAMTDGGGNTVPDWYVDGTVSNISTTTKTEEVKDSKGKTHMQTYYRAMVGVTLHVKDAQTDKIVLSPSFNVAAEDLAWIETREGAINNAFSRMATYVMRYFDRQLPLTANIIEGAKDKKDKQKEVYIDLGGATKGVAKGIHFGVYTTRTVAGREARKQVGKIKITDVMGDDISLCKVQSGGKDIKAAIDGGETIVVVSLD